MLDPENEQHRQEKSDRYAKLGRLQLRQAQQELNRGDAVQASEKAYGAVSAAAKAYGEKRGWNHYNHHRVSLILEQLRDEENDPALTRDYDAVKSLHDNFFEYELNVTRVQDRIGTARELCAALESLRQGEPHPLPSESLSREQRRRLTLLMQPPQKARLSIEDLPAVEDLPQDDLPPEE